MTAKAKILLGGCILLVGWMLGRPASPLVSAPVAPPGVRRTGGMPAGQCSTASSVLYDGMLGGTPNTQALLFMALPAGTASQTVEGGYTVLDTMAHRATYAGYFASSALVPAVPTLDRTRGYVVRWRAQIEAEQHVSQHRAGFSVIALSQDLQGIELAFWENEIWAQEDDRDAPDNLFTHAEGVAFDPTGGLVCYELVVAGDTYTLWAAGTPLLTGRLRDYSNFEGNIDPYETPNFLFFGDDTSSARARIRLSFVGVAVNRSTFLPLLQHESAD